MRAMLSCMLVLVLAVMITPSQAFGPQPGSKGDYNPVTPQELEKYNLSLQNYLSDSEPIPGVTYAELVALGEPTKYRSQVVSGYKYYFEWDSGDVVEVWEQTWTDKMEIQTWHCLDNSAPPCKA